MSLLQKLFARAPRKPAPLICNDQYEKHCMHDDGVSTEEMHHGKCWRSKETFRTYSCCRPGCGYFYELFVGMSPSGWVEMGERMVYEPTSTNL